MRQSQGSRARAARLSWLVLGLCVACEGSDGGGGAGTTASGTGGSTSGSGGSAMMGTGGPGSGSGGMASGAGGASSGTGGSTSGSGGGPGGMPSTGGSGATCDACVTMPVSWGFMGGLVAYTDVSGVAPCNHYARMRSQGAGSEPGAYCTNDVPCDGAVTAGQVESALEDPAVQDAIENETLFGVDNRPVDAPIFELRVGYQTVLVGEPCSGQPSCVAIPASVQAVVDLLQQLDAQQLAAAPCVGMFE